MLAPTTLELHELSPIIAATSYRAFPFLLPEPINSGSVGEIDALHQLLKAIPCPGLEALMLTAPRDRARLGNWALEA